jgi:hypothetical protein
MSLLNNEKLKQLYKKLPQNIVVSASWFEENNISMQLRYKYLQSEWLFSIGKSAYIINPQSFTWEGLLIGIQQFVKLPYYIGGLKALELQGFAHYLPIGDENKITLYGKKTLPAWLKNLNIDYKLELIKKPSYGSLYLKSFSTNIEDYDLKISSPERAIFELIYLVEKDGITFDFVAEIFEGLTTLRPNVINELLQETESEKIKRLFVFLMEYFNHPWKSFVDTDKIDIGTGKMQIVKGGCLDKKYLITIPKEYVSESK